MEDACALPQRLCWRAASRCPRGQVSRYQQLAHCPGRRSGTGIGSTSVAADRRMSRKCSQSAGRTTSRLPSACPASSASRICSLFSAMTRGWKSTTGPRLRRRSSTVRANSWHVPRTGRGPLARRARRAGESWPFTVQLIRGRNGETAQCQRCPSWDAIRGGPRRGLRRRSTACGLTLVCRCVRTVSCDGPRPHSRSTPSPTCRTGGRPGTARSSAWPGSRGGAA